MQTKSKTVGRCHFYIVTLLTTVTLDFKQIQLYQSRCKRLRNCFQYSVNTQLNKLKLSTLNNN